MARARGLFKALQLLLFSAVIAVGCSTARQDLSESGTTVALSVEVPVANEDQILAFFDERMGLDRTTDEFRRPIAGWILSDIDEGLLEYHISLSPYPSAAELEASIEALKEVGATSIVELGVDDRWPGCDPPECTITVWDTVGSRY